MQKFWLAAACCGMPRHASKPPPTAPRIWRCGMLRHAAACCCRWCKEGACARCAHHAHARSARRVRHLNTFARQWSTFEALANTVPWWGLLNVANLWQGVRPPLGELTCNRCSDRPKDDKLLRANPNFAAPPQSLMQCQGQCWAKAQAPTAQSLEIRCNGPHNNPRIRTACTARAPRVILTQRGGGDHANRRQRSSCT